MIRKTAMAVSMIAIVFLVLVAAVATVGLFALIYNTAAINPILVRTQTGLVLSDSLSTGNTNDWKFGGDAVGLNATYFSSENASGLYLGVRPSTSGVWTGYYATINAGNAQVFKATLALPYRTISNGSFNTGLYVQTSQHPVNYVACGAGVTPKESYWQVVVGIGNITLASNFKVLYFAPDTNGSLTRTCTIITNGNNLLNVYLDGVQIYSNNSASLNMPPPFNSYLLVDSISNEETLYGSYSNYLSTLGETLSITNAPAGGSVKLTDSQNNILSSATVAPNGTATLPLPLNGTSFSAYIKVYAPGGNLVTATSQPVQIWGGDVYSLRGSL